MWPATGIPTAILEEAKSEKFNEHSVLLTRSTGIGHQQYLTCKTCDCQAGKVGLMSDQWGGKSHLKNTGILGNIGSEVRYLTWKT